MLNLKDIADRIERPELRKTEDIQSLKELMHKYPYAQIFPLLYLNQLAKSNSVHFEEELQKYAYRITDREVLYHLIHATPETAVEHTIEEPFNDSETIEPIKEVEVDSEVIESELKEETSIENEPQIETNSETTDGLEKIEEHSIHSVENEVEETEDASEVANTSQEIDAYEKELLAQTLAASYSLEAEEDVKPSDNLEDLIHEIQHKKEDSELVLEEEDEIIEDIESEIQPSEFKEPVSLDAKLSFSSWLRSDSHYFENHPEEKAQEIQSDKDIEQLFEGRKEKKEFFSPTKKAKESLDENRVPVSETLAKIFIMQGNYPKAIYAYEQLMLIIPEKKSFFANQIKELKKKLNS